MKPTCRHLASLAAVLGLGIASHVAFAAGQFGQQQHGHALVDAGDCEACHTAENGKPFAGGRPIQTPFGIIYSSNITPDRQTGIGAWTSNQFYRAMHKGISADGRHLYPAFPYPWFTKVTRLDVNAIFAYLRTLPAVKNKQPKNKFPWPLSDPNVLIGWNALYFHAGTYKPDNKKSAQWNRGAYLVEGLGHCGACHTPRNMLGAAEKANFLQGSKTDNWFAPSLTGNAKNGLGAWTESDIVQFLKTGHTGKTVAYGPMAQVVTDSTSKMSDDDLKAITVYLKSLPAPKNQKPAGKPAENVAKVGAAIYADTCSACHGFRGEGTKGLFPALKGSAIVQSESPLTVVRLILNGGRSVSVSHRRTAVGMPSFGWKLSDKQIAAVASYVRSAWGNSASTVSPSEVHDLRQLVKSASSAAD
jgi:mono/diheme cytochrome c family protein